MRPKISIFLLAFPLLVQLSQDTAPVVLHVRAPNGGPVVAQVLDQDDRAISRLHPVAPNTFVWDGRGRDGRPVRPGTYVVEVEEEPYLWSSAISVKQ